MICAVIFDLGHTLWDIGPGGESLDRAYEQARATLTQRLGDANVPKAAALKRSVGDALRADAETYFMVSEHLDQPPTWTWVERGFRTLGLALDQRALDEITPPLFATEIEHLVCHEGTLAAVQTLHDDGYAIGCVTNTLADTRAIRRMLRVHGFEPLMRSVVVSADEGWRKPHRSLFEKALRELGCAAEDAVFVGDSPFHDVGGAQAVGMRAVLTTQYVTRSTEDMPVADATISHLRELRDVISRW